MEGYCHALKPEDLESIYQNKETGMQLLSDYSGTGQSEHVWRRFEVLARDHGREPQLRTARASDIDKHSRAVLSAFDADGESDAMCVLGDIVARQSKCFQKKLLQ